MRNKSRTEQVGVKCTSEVKNFLIEHKKLTKESPGDLLEEKVKSLQHGEYAGKRIIILQEEIETYTETINLIQKKVNELRKELKELKLSPNAKHFVNETNNEKILQTVKSYYRVLESNNTPLGFRHDFDKELAAERLCAVHGTDMETFNKVIHMIEKDEMDVNDVDADFLEMII